MENSKILKMILILSGLILILVGEGTLMNPATFLARHEIVLGENISLISELKSHGGVFLGLGILILSGAFINRLSFTSTIVSTVVYVSFVIARVISMIVDGTPADGLIGATYIELFLGLASIFALLKYRTKNKPL
jgi:hypothetical protein